MKRKWLFPHISPIRLKNSPICKKFYTKYFLPIQILPIEKKNSPIGKSNIFSLLQYWHKPEWQHTILLSQMRSTIFTHKFWSQSKTRKVTSVQKFVNMSTNNLSTSKRRIDAISSVFICFTYFFHFIVRLDAIYQVASRVCGLCQNCRNVSQMTFLLTFAYTNWLSAYRNRSSCKHIFQMKISHSVLIRFWWNKPFMKAIS
jgi:hypothetical protein